MLVVLVTTHFLAFISLLFIFHSNHHSIVTFPALVPVARLRCTSKFLSFQAVLLLFSRFLNCWLLRMLCLRRYTLACLVEYLCSTSCPKTVVRCIPRPRLHVFAPELQRDSKFLFFVDPLYVPGRYRRVVVVISGITPHIHSRIITLTIKRLCKVYA